MATLKDVRNILVELDEMTGLNGASLDLKQNNGKRVLASHVFQNVRDASGKIVQRRPVRFEFSKLSLSCDMDTLREIVKHEYAHYMALVKYNDNCGHDWRFKEMCKQIGANANETTYTNQSIMQASVKLAKYVVTCDNCGHQYTYSRKCRTLDLVRTGSPYVTCKCGSHNFTYKQNY